MRTLAIDTETTGTPVRGYPPDDPCQPRLCQFAAVLIDDDGRERSAASIYIKPDVAIPEGAARVHGITDDVAATWGVPEIAAVGLFIRMASVADLIIAFQAEFDMSIMRFAAARAKMPSPPWLSVPVRCVMTAASPIVNLPPTERMIAAGYGDKPKAPKLGEAYEFAFGRKLEGAHDAMVDVRACVELYRWLLGKGCWKEAA